MNSNQEKEFFSSENTEVTNETPKDTELPESENINKNGDGNAPEGNGETAKKAEFRTFSIIKVLKSSLLFAKVVLLYKVRNFAEHLRKISTIFVFNKIL